MIPLQVNSRMIKNILTLRYDPTCLDMVKTYSSRDFEPMYDEIDVDRIESIISTTIQQNVKGDDVSIALSGGVDSILLLALLRKTLPDIHIHAISVKFVDSVDETSIATSLASKFNADHHIITVDNVLEMLPKSIGIVGKPFWDMHWYYVAKAARQFSSTLISGDGGDELFGGYTFRYHKFLSKTSANMTPRDKARLYLECHERDWVPDQDMLFGERLGFSWNEIHANITPYFENELEELDQVFLADINGKLPYNWTITNNVFNDYFKIKSVTPLLSDDLIEYALHMRNSLKYDPASNLGKIPLRKVLSRYVDAEYITRGKQGFSVNTANLYQAHGRDMCHKYLSDARIVADGYISDEWITRYLQGADEPSVRHINKLFGLLAFEIWYRIFVTEDMVAA